MRDITGADTLIFDPFAGVSGDMTLGALIDLGLDAEWLRTFVAELGLGDVVVHVERANRRGIDCGRVHFDLPHEHAHRHLRHVLEIIDRSNTTSAVKARAADTFRRIASAEAEVHGTTVEKVHFHEVGALDAILDVLCAMAGIEQLGFTQFHTRPVALGSGWVDIAHGRFPVPAPATLKILHGIEVTGTELTGECTTPTGAAIVAALTNGQPAPAAFTPVRSGFGAGTRDPHEHPNCVRLIAASVPSESLLASETLLIVQADIDDLSPEYAAPALDAILTAGARDAVFLPLVMKKGRPGMRLEVLVGAPQLTAVTAAIFQATPTIGLRHWRVERPELARSVESLDFRGQRIRYKRVTLPDGTVRSKPEFDDVVKAAQSLDLAAWQVRQAVEAEVDRERTDR